MEVKRTYSEFGGNVQALKDIGHVETRLSKKKFTLISETPNGDRKEKTFEREYKSSSTQARLLSKTIYALKNPQSDEGKALMKSGISMDYIKNVMFRPHNIWLDDKNIIRNADSLVGWQSYLDFDDLVMQPYEEMIGIDTIVKSRGRIKRARIRDQILGFQRRTPRGGATRSMQPDRGSIPQDSVGFEQVFVPVPFIHAAFKIGARVNEIPEVYRENAAAALRAVRESVTDLYLNGDSRIAVRFNNANQTIKGLLNQPNAQSETQLSGTGAWSQANIRNGNASPYDDIVSWVNSLQKNKLAQGPYMMLFGQDAFTALKHKVSGRDYTNFEYLRRNMSDVEAMPAGRYQEMADNQVIIVDSQSLMAGVAVEPSITQVTMGNGIFSDEFVVYCAETPVFIEDTENNIGILKVLVA